MDHELPESSVVPDSLTCQAAVALLTDYMTGALPAPMTQAFEAHIDACADCLAYCETYRATVRLTQTLRYEAIPAALQERLLSFLQAQRTGTALSPPREAWEQ